MTLSKTIQNQIPKMDLGDLEALKALVDEAIAAKQAKTTEASATSGAIAGLPSNGYYERFYVPKPNGKTYGPYLRYCWMEGDKKRSKYLGKAAPQPIPGERAAKPQTEHAHPQAS